MNKEKELVNKLFKNKTLPKDELNILVNLVKKYDNIEYMLDTIILANMDSYFIKNNKDNNVHINPFTRALRSNIELGKEHYKNNIINSMQFAQIVGCLKSDKYRMDGKEYCDIKYDTDDVWGTIIDKFLTDIKYE